MRILHLSRRYAPDVIGGYERNCQRFAEEWSRRGHEVAVLTRATSVAAADGAVQVFRTLPDVSSETRTGGIRNRAYQLQISLANRRCAQATRDLLRRWSPDVVVFWGMNSWLVSPVVEVNAAGVPYLFDVGDYWLAESLALYGCDDAAKQMYRRRVLLGADFDAGLVHHAIVHSEFMRTYYLQRGVAPAALHVIRRGVPLTAGNKSEPGADAGAPIRIACVGRLVPDKGALVLAQAFDALERVVSNARLDFYGDSRPEYRAALEDLCRGRGLLGTKVFVHGHVAPEEMARVYTEADIVAFPVLWDEPSSNVLLEAMAAGIPIVCTNTGSNAEFVLHERTGLVVQRDDAEALMHALRRLAQAPAERRTMGAAARQRVDAGFRLDRVFDQTEQFIATIIRNGGPARRSG